MELDRTADIRKVDHGIKNRWNWKWMEVKDSNETFLSDYMRKIDKPGFARCKICNCDINYGSGGKRDLVAHSMKKKHRERSNIQKTNTVLPAMFMRPVASTSSIANRDISNKTCTESELPYGVAPNVHNTFECSGKVRVETQPNISFADRKANAEAMIVSFGAENSLTFTVQSKIIKLAQALAKDPHVLQDLSMERTTLAYKLKEGVAEVTHQRIVEELRSTPFSINLDECNNRANNKVLTILVSYFSDNQGECVVQHYASVEMTVVNADTVYQAVVKMLSRDKIPLANVVSSLSDSAAYMRGVHSGFEAKLRNANPNLLDVDGDICHHMHNCAKKFCGYFNNHVEFLCDDLYNDFKYSPDLREVFEEICMLYGVDCKIPLQRIPHRWLSSYDASVRTFSVLDQLTIFYVAWASSAQKTNNLSLYRELTSSLSTMKHARLNVIIQQLKKKKMTEQGRKRKERIAHKLFSQRETTVFYMHLYEAVLPMFKSIVLIFEQKIPMVHRLHDEIIELFRSFLACFIKHEAVAAQGHHPHKLKSLELGKHLLKLSQLHVGKAAELNLLQMKPDKVKSLLMQVRKAYLDTGLYMQKKLPLKNHVLMCLSALDPKAQGNSKTFEYLKELGKLFKHHMSIEQQEAYDKAARQMQIVELPVLGEDTSLDKWWNKVFKSHPAMKPAIKCALSIFTGPRVEQSFSIMNEVICPKTNRLQVSTFEAIQTVKYDLQASHQTSIERYHRKDKLKSPVDRHLCHHMQISHRQHKKKQEAKRQAKLAKGAVKKKTSVKNVHKAADAIKKRMAQQQKARDEVQKKKRTN